MIPHTIPHGTINSNNFFRRNTIEQRFFFSKNVLQIFGCVNVVLRLG